MQLISELEDQIKNANIVKSLVLEKLVLDKLISEEDAKNFDETYQLTIVNNYWFPTISKLLEPFGKKTEQYIFKFIKF
jgi:hypothetical protein